MPAYLATDAEDGYEVLGAGRKWFSHTNGFLSLGAVTSHAGIRFPLHTVFDTEGRPLAPNNVTSLSLRLNLTTIGIGNLVVTMATSPTLAAFSGSNFPSDVASVAAATHVVTAAQIGVDTEIALVLPTASSTYTPPWHSSRWNGYLGFIVNWDGAQTMSIAAAEHASLAEARLTTTEIPFITGIEGHVKAMSRIDRCPRCGVLMPREKFVEDGYTQGLLVCPKCWDPVDPPTRPIPPDAPPIND